MEKYIERLCKTLKLELLAAWLLAAVVMAMGEMGVIPNGVVEPHSQDEFLLNTATIVLTVIGIPVAMRLFSLNSTRGLRRMNNEEALQSYHLWCGVRMGILALAAVLGLVAYYLSANMSGAFCALIALGMTLACWPTQSKIGEYVASVNND